MSLMLKNLKSLKIKSQTAMKYQNGIGIIEVVVSFVVLGIMVAAIAPMMTANVWSLENTLARNAAAYKAERMLDSLQMAGIHQVTTVTDFPCSEAGVDKRAFTCSITPTVLTTNFEVVTSKKVVVTINWTINRVHTLSVEGVVQ
tara:strand:- start:849 stop:1280 length:432 start_codon:yes stop_codon:yes gene_type:complete